MQTFTPEQYAIDMNNFTSNNILFKAIKVHLNYYRQQGLPATIKSDIKDNARALTIAYLMLQLNQKREKRRTLPSETYHEPVPAMSFMHTAVEEFAPIATAIRECFDQNGYSTTSKVLKEYWGYMTEVAVPILMCGDYDGSKQWEPNLYSVD